MPTYEPFDWYQVPLYYDIIFDSGTQQEADFLQTIYEIHLGPRPGRILEPACGTGRLMAELARRGFQVSGFDASTPMLDFARRRFDASGVQGELKRGRLEKFTCRRRFDLAHCLVSTFLYLSSDDDARRHLQCAARALRKGGIYVLGLHLSNYQDRSRTRERWVGQRDGLHVTCNIQAWPADRVRRTQAVRSRFLIEQAGQVRGYETNWHFRTWNWRQLTQLLASVPEFEHVGTYSFQHDIEYAVSLNDGQLDKVLVLRRR